MWWSNRHRRGESKGCLRDGWIDFGKGLGREENAAGARLDPSHNLEQCLPPRNDVGAVLEKRCAQ